LRDCDRQLLASQTNKTIAATNLCSQQEKDKSLHGSLPEKRPQHPARRMPTNSFLVASAQAGSDLAHEPL